MIKIKAKSVYQSLQLGQMLQQWKPLKYRYPFKKDKTCRPNQAGFMRSFIVKGLYRQDLNAGEWN